MNIAFGRLTLSFLCTLVLSLAFTLHAQDLDDVTISGKITDPNGLPIAGATVTATSVDTGAERTLVTNEEGKYTFVKLKPGVYRVRAVGNGFGVQETGSLTTISAQNVQLDFKLTPASVRAEQTVTVSE